MSRNNYIHPHSQIVTAIDRALEILEMGGRADLKQFLTEIAIMESGGNPRGEHKITHHTKNPFQLTGPAIRDTKTDPEGYTHWTIRPLHALIKRNAKLTKSWNEQPEEEIKHTSINLNALTALLYIIRREIVPAPTMGERAQQWKTKYNTTSDPHGTPQIYIEKNSLPRIAEGLELIMPKQKIIDANLDLVNESKSLPDVLYKPLNAAIEQSEFWTYDNTWDIDGPDINRVLKSDVDQTEAAEVLTSALNWFFRENRIPTHVAVHTPDVTLNPKSSIGPGHKNYPNRLVIGANQGIAAQDRKHGSSKFLMNLFLGTYDDNFSISDIDPKQLAKNIGALIRHELVHLGQIEKRRKNQRISRLRALQSYREEGEIPDTDNRKDYLSSKIEIDAYANEIAEEMFNKWGKDGAIERLRKPHMINPDEISDQMREYFVDHAEDAFVRRLKRKIYGNILSYAARDLL